MTELSPREIVSELDRFIIGQADAKRAVAIALRNRWRRRQLPAEAQEEVQPRNILMIGPTGVGKTEISRRLAKLAGAPFLKVEATKFTEVGYVGRDVDTIIRDLLEVAIGLVRTRHRAAVRVQAEEAAEDRVIAALVGATASEGTRESFRRRLRNGELDDREIEIEVSEQAPAMPFLEIPGQPGGLGGGLGGPVGGNMADLFGKMFGRPTRKRKVRVSESHTALLADEADKLLDEERIVREAIESVEQTGIVFIDEIDKVCARAEARGADVSREGVQRDLLPLIEGATVATRHGPVKTDHILFIASGAFHLAKPSDLLPELQGRLPIRVELQPLVEADFVRILVEPEHSLTLQANALLETEGVTLTFAESGVSAIAAAAAEMNAEVENIGARRLHTIVERVLAELSFSAPDLTGEQKTVVVDAAYVEAALADLSRRADLKRYIL